LEREMITQCIAAMCTFAIVVLAILIMTRALSLDDALKSAGKMLLLIVLVYFAICTLVPLLNAGAAALAVLLKAAPLWLAVAVIAAGLLILILRVLRRKFSARPSSGGSRN
jgi:hypothetical protein